MLMRLTQNNRPELFSRTPFGSIFDSPFFSQSSHSLLRDLIHQENPPETGRLFFNPRRIQMRTEETNDGYCITYSVPGLTEKEISLSVLNQEVTLTTQPATDDEDNQAQRYSSTCVLPEEIQPEEITATLENGILSVAVKKAVPTKPRLIEINTP